MIELRRMRWDGNLTPMGEKRNACSFRCETLKEGDSLEDLDIGKRVIRNWFLKKEGEWLWTGVIRLGVGESVGCCEQANEISGSIK
jgi:hypothetical protein